MLQSGGGNNTSAALLRQYFSHEQKCDEHMRKTVKANHNRSPRGNRTGVLPIITSATDIASLRRTRRPASQSPRARLGTPKYPLPYELPRQGIGYKLQEPIDDEPFPADGSVRGVKTLPSHGKKPPYGRKMITREFFDEMSGGGIACLNPQQLSPPQSARGSHRRKAHVSD